MKNFGAHDVFLRSCWSFGLRWLYSIALRGCTFEVAQETFFIYCFTAAVATSQLILGLSSQTPFHQSSEVEIVMSASVFVEHNLSQIPKSAKYLDFSSSPSNNFGEPSNSICGKIWSFAPTREEWGGRGLTQEQLFKKMLLIPSNANVRRTLFSLLWIICS